MAIEQSGDAFEQRRKSLEEVFFMQRDRELLEKMKNEMESFEEQQKLAHVSGILDEAVLMNLVKAGMRADTLAALSTIPMVEVAWCDGSVSAQEKAAVLNAAASMGIKVDSAPHDLLDRWLTDRPDSRLVAAWKEYVRELARVMPADTVSTMRRNMLDRCQRVAEAAGGFVGLHRISRMEQATIDDFAKAFEG